MSEAEHLANLALAWLRDHYNDHCFFLERDVVWTLQRRIESNIRESNSQLRVFNDYPMIPGPRRSLSTDLAIVSAQNCVELAIEFKYEPCHRRTDLLKQKLPVVIWGTEGVRKDVERVRQYVGSGKAQTARSYFIDEGGFFARRPPHAGSVWIPWGGDRWVLESPARASHYVLDNIEAGERALAERGGVSQHEVEQRYGL